MELLTIQHEDFKLSVECTKFDDIWRKAARNIGEGDLLSTYSWSDGVVSVVRHSLDEELEIENGKQYPAIFFDNADYPIWVEFNDYVKDAQFGSTLQSENDKFSFRRHILAGFLNYGNEIGKSELNLIYKVGDISRKFTFSFEVLSTKLNYHEHWKRIIEDIEREYRMLSLDYMRRTFHGFSTDPKGSTPEIVWWSVFAGEQEKFIRACKNILDRPRHRLHGQVTYKRADQLTYVPTNIENELAEHRKEGAHLYNILEKTQTNDTQENRFLKFAIAQIATKYEVLKERIENLNNISDSMRNEIQETSNTLKRLQRHPFFRTIGRYKGMNQESLVLQKAMGYSQVYRTWNLLRRGYSLNDGIYRLQTKDIATLYEIWCFIEMSHIVKEKLHLNDEDIDHRNRMELNGLFTWELGKGEHSRILFRKDGIELAELVYNPKSTDKENNSTGLSDIIVPTVPQKPDIVLQLTKNDIREGMKMTYLFDAKYRIDRRENDVDFPPDDAINQMHRYRDSIYFEEYPSKALKKEVIGGYILFPGDGTPTDIATSKFYESIKKVNIGAFPLRPKDENNRKLLEDFISILINRRGYELIADVIPQKGTFVDVANRVLIGLVENNELNSEQSFIDCIATQYCIGKHLPSGIELHDLHYFIPYIKGKGIRDLYEITSIHIGESPYSSTQMQDSTNENQNNSNLIFEIRFSRKLFYDFEMINAKNMPNDMFWDTTFAEKENWINRVRI